MQEKENTFFTGLRVNSVTTFVTAYDGEGAEPTPTSTPDPTPPPAQPPADPPPAATPPAASAPPVVINTPAPAAAESGMLTITQEHFDEIIKKRVNTVRKQGEDAVSAAKQEAETAAQARESAMLADKTDLVSQLEEFKAKSQGSEEEKQLLQKQIDAIKNETLTAEEQAAKNIAELEERATAAEAAAAERDTFVKGYMMDNELRSAIAANNASAPDQLFQILKASTATGPKTDAQGNEIPGLFEVLTSISVKNDAGEKETISVSPAEAVAKLKGNVEEWGNQFKSEVKSGSGLVNDKGSTETFGKEPPTDPQKYREWRNSPAGQEFLGRDKRNRFVGSS